MVTRSFESRDRVSRPDCRSRDAERAAGCRATPRTPNWSSAAAPTTSPPARHRYASRPVRGIEGVEVVVGRAHEDTIARERRCCSARLLVRVPTRMTVASGETAQATSARARYTPVAVATIAGELRRRLASRAAIFLTRPTCAGPATGSAWPAERSVGLQDWGGDQFRVKASAPNRASRCDA